MTKPVEPRPVRRSAVRFQPKAILALTIVWLALVGEVTVVTVVGGAILATLVTVVFPLPPLHWAGHVNPWGLVLLAAHLLKDLATASFALAAAAFGRRPPRSGIVRVDLLSDNDLYQVNTAELCSVVPGTLVVDARPRRRQLYLHVFGVTSEDGRAKAVRDTLALERRVVRAFGSREEIEALDAAAAGRGEPRDPGQQPWEGELS